MKNKSIKKQMENSKIETSTKGGITIDDIKQVVNYVFRDASKEATDNNLYVTDDEEYLSFRFGRITTGYESFIKMFNDGIIFDIENIYYNGVLLDEAGRKQFYEHTLNFGKKIKTKR